MSDSMIDGIHLLPSPEDPSLKKEEIKKEYDILRELLSSLADSVSHLSKVSMFTSSQVKDFLDAIDKQKTQYQTEEEDWVKKLEKIYRNSDEVRRLEKVIKSFSEIIRLSEIEIAIRKKDTNMMAKWTEAVMNDKEAYKERVKGAKETNDAQRKYADKNFFGNIAKFALGNILGPALTSNRFIDHKAELDTQAEDLYAIKTTYSAKEEGVRNRQLLEEMLGKETSDIYHASKASKNLHDLELVQEKQRIFSALSRGENPFAKGEDINEESVIYGEGPTSSDLKRIPSPQKLLPFPEGERINDLGRGEGVIEASSDYPYRDSQGRFAKRPFYSEPVDETLSTIGKTLLDNPENYSNQQLIKSFTTKSSLHPSASEVAENSPSAFSAGFLYLGDLLIDSSAQAKKDAEAVAEASALGGGGGGGIIDTIGKLFSSVGVLSAIGTALSPILSVALPILGVTAGVVGIVALINSAIKNNAKKNKEIIDNLTPEEREEIFRGVPKGDKGSEVVAPKTIDLSTTNATDVDLSGTNTKAIMLGEGGSGQTVAEILKAKQEKQKNDIASVGNPFERGLWGFGGLKNHFYWQKDTEGNYWYSPNASMEPKAYIIPGDLSSEDKQRLYNFGGFFHNNLYEQETEMDMKYPGSGFDAVLDKAGGSPIKFHAGGIVPGPIGKEQNARVLGGEVYLSPPESKEFAKNLQTIVDGLTETTTAQRNSPPPDYIQALIEHLQSNKKVLGDLLTEMKKNTEAIVKQNLTVDVPSPMPTPSRQFQLAQ